MLKVFDVEEIEERQTRFTSQQFRQKPVIIYFNRVKGSKSNLGTKTN